MAVKIRLQRHGKKDNAFFHLVVADGRAPRDGKFIEKLGTYNPNTNPATIDINFDRTLDWMMKGAETTDTSRAILSYKGILMKKHLLEGVRKGALTQEQAEAKFTKWLGEKDSKIVGKKENLSSAKKDAYTAKLKAESSAKETRAAKIAVKNTPVAEEKVEEQHTEHTDAPATEENNA